MKIGLVRRGYGGTGGAERYLLRFAEALHDARHQAVLFGSEEWPAWKGDFIQVKGDSPAAFATALRKLNPRERCDVVYSMERVWECDAYRAGDGVHKAWLERRRRFEPAWNGWFRSLRGKHRELLSLEKAVFSESDNRLIIANSRMVAEEVEKYFRVPKNRVRVVYNGLPAGLHGAAGGKRAETRAKFGLKADDCVLLFAGSGWERKGLRFAIKAVERTKNATLLVAGEGKRTGLPPSSRTQFLGAVTGMRDLMEAADVFLLPTIYDPFSNASLEAMAAGLPVITTSANGFSEVMRPGLDGEVLENPADIAGIVAGIEKWCGADSVESREARRLEARRYTIEENVWGTLVALADVGKFELRNAMPVAGTRPVAGIRSR